MFCGECGTKNKKGAQFCENCGAKMETPKKEVFVKEKKPMTKKNKIITGVVGLAAIIVVASCIFLGSLTSPKNIAEKVFNATVNYDFDTIYKYLNVEDSEFTSKEMFNKVMTSNYDIEDKPVIVNYSVGEPVISDDKMSATVTITYMMKDKDKSDTFDVKLVKDKNKKWLFFDNWLVNTKGIDVAKNYKIEVAKGSTISVEGIALSSNYLNSEESNENYDVYVIPSIFEARYEVNITLPIGLQVTSKMNVYDNGSYKYRMSLNDLTNEVKDNLISISKSSLQTLYDGVKEQKSFDDIKSNFEYENGDLTTLKSDYENLVNSIGTSIKLTTITFKEIKISDVNITSENKLKLYLKVSYDYSVSYESSGETKTHDSNDYDYLYLTFDYVNGNYKLVDTSSLITYFSKYY